MPLYTYICVCMCVCVYFTSERFMLNKPAMDHCTWMWLLLILLLLLLLFLHLFLYYHHHHHHHHELWRVSLSACSLKLVPPSFPRVSYVSPPFCSACLGIRFCPFPLSVVATFADTYVLPEQCSAQPSLSLMDWFLSQPNLTIPKWCFKFHLWYIQALFMSFPQHPGFTTEF